MKCRSKYFYSFIKNRVTSLQSEEETPTPTDTPTPFLLSCISKDTIVNIVNENGYKYAFGSNGYQTPFKLNVGIYKLVKLSTHPIFLEGHDESKIQITGTETKT